MNVLQYLFKQLPFSVLVSFFLLYNLPMNGQNRTRFKDMNTTPNYKVIQRIVKSKRLRLKEFYGQKWKSGNYKAAWQRVDKYFPENFYYSPSKKTLCLISFHLKEGYGCI